MRKNALARLEANTVARGLGAWAGRWFRSRPVVPDDAFQDQDEPYPGHWREFPTSWEGEVSRQELDEALATLPKPWREALLRPSARPDAQERDLVARARAALRDALSAQDSRR